MPPNHPKNWSVPSAGLRGPGRRVDRARRHAGACTSSPTLVRSENTGRVAGVHCCAPAPSEPAVRAFPAARLKQALKARRLLRLLSGGAFPGRCRGSGAVPECAAGRMPRRGSSSRSFSARWRTIVPSLAGIAVGTRPGVAIRRSPRSVSVLVPKEAPAQSVGGGFVLCPPAAGGPVLGQGRVVR